MIVGYEAKRIFSNYTGLGNYARTLIENLHIYGGSDFQSVLFTPKKVENSRTAAILTHSKIITPQNKMLWRSAGQTRHWNKESIQLYHGLSNEIPVVVKSKALPIVVTMHDLIFLQFPAMYRPIDRWIYDQKSRYAVKRADSVIAISEATKEALIEFYKVPDKKIKVIYQSADQVFENFMPFNEKSPPSLLRYNLPPKYFIYVGSINERKQLLQVFKALLLLPDSLRIPIVVVGSGKEYFKKIRQFITQHNVEKYFHHIPDISFTDLPNLYQKAQGLIYPSLFEGFGIPIIEALWCRCPVISGNSSSMPEAAGTDSVLVDVRKTEEIATAMQRLLEDEFLREEVAESGYNYVQKFHSKNVSSQMLNLYKSLI